MQSSTGKAKYWPHTFISAPGGWYLISCVEASCVLVWTRGGRVHIFRVGPGSRFNIVIRVATSQQVRKVNLIFHMTPLPFKKATCVIRRISFLRKKGDEDNINFKCGIYVNEFVFIGMFENLILKRNAPCSKKGCDSLQIFILTQFFKISTKRHVGLENIAVYKV